MNVAVLLSLDDAPGRDGVEAADIVEGVAVLLSLDDAPGHDEFIKLRK